jgi:hypothetical protein
MYRKGKVTDNSGPFLPEHLAAERAIACPFPNEPEDFMNTSKQPRSASQTPPDQHKLNAIQTNRLAKLTGVNAAALKGQSIATLADRFKWVIDPSLFGFRRICGQVVKWDPVAGEDRPVPFAAVHVMDTDCDFLGYFPYGLPWAWCFPIFCHQEELATVVTDECGHFCVWVPWFDIDWVIRWRLERHCYPEIFVKPSLREILEHLGALEVAPRPGPGPDPGPNILKDGGLTIERIAAVAGRQTAMKLASAVRATRVGGKTGLVKGVLDERAFTLPMPPPHSAKLRQFQQHGNKAIPALSTAGTREYKLDLNRYVGPFPRWRCEWVIEEELVPIIDVPDITFWVTQDVDGDGDQETIYSDGYFDVGWHTGPLSDITLHASPIARASTTCDVPPVGDCGEPEILFAGLMLARAPYIDMATGYGDRPNPPHADAVVRPSVFPPAPTPDTPSTAPFMGTVQLYGCNQLPGGQYYRLLYSYNGERRRCPSQTCPGGSIHFRGPEHRCMWFPMRRDGIRYSPIPTRGGRPTSCWIGQRLNSPMADMTSPWRSATRRRPSYSRRRQSFPSWWTMRRLRRNF